MRILVAIDESDASDAAVRVAASLGSALKADLSLLHAHRPRITDTGADSPESGAVRILSDRGVPARIEVRSGEPAGEILALTRSLKPDLLVMGSRGRSMLAGMLLGSVSQEVVAEAMCPVLLVRADAAEVEAPYTIVLAVEGLAGLKPLVQITRKLARALPATVYAVHVGYPGGDEVERAVYHAPRSHGEQALAAAVAWLSQAGVTVEARPIAARKGTSRALAEFADSVDADLVVMGAHRPQPESEAAGIHRAIAVAHLTDQPVLVAREEAGPR